jgi:hypothetical protein
VPRDALEDVADAGPGLLQHARLASHDPGEVRPDEHRGDLEDELVDVGVARQLAPGNGLTQRLGELFNPLLLQLHHPVAGTPGTRRELHRDGREEAAAREHPPLQVPEERLAERPCPTEASGRLARRAQNVPLEDLSRRLTERNSTSEASEASREKHGPHPERQTVGRIDVVCPTDCCGKVSGNSEVQL